MDVEGIDIRALRKGAAGAFALPVFEQAAQILMGRQGLPAGLVIDRERRLPPVTGQAVPDTRSKSRLQGESLE
jgi:hypothetical protein